MGASAFPDRAGAGKQSGQDARLDGGGLQAQWEYTIGGDNVLDEYPDEIIPANTTGGQIPYSAASPFGFNGAFVYGKVGYKW